MTAAMDKRVARLEDHPRFSAETVGVGAIDLATADLSSIQRYADAYGLPGRCAMWLVDGPDAIVLPPQPVGRVQGQDEALWVRAGDTYPHVVAVWNDGAVAAWRFDSAADRVAFERSPDDLAERMLS